MTTNSPSVPDLINTAQAKIEQIKQEIGKIVIGQHHLVNCLLIGVFADGHLLLEGVPGVAKTEAVQL